MNNIILVDSSYTSFHRFFATMRWFSLAKKEIYQEHKNDNKYDWSTNEIFFEKYKKMYLDSIIKLVSKKVFDNSVVVFCLDCKQSNIWRNNYKDDYKGGRQDLSEKYNFKNVFKKTYEEHIPSLIKNNGNIFSIKKNKIEADDIIALCTRYIKCKYPSKKIYLVSGDQDFYQLGYDNLYFADYKKKDLIQFTKKEAKNQLYLKIINGDCSDNIPSIFPKELKISNKRRKMIREDNKELIKYLKEYSEAKKIYKLNKFLIDFKNIPKEYHKSIYKKIKQILKSTTI